MKTKTAKDTFKFGYDLASGKCSDCSVYAIMTVGRKNGRKNGKTEFVILSTGKTYREAERNLEKHNRQFGTQSSGTFVMCPHKRMGHAFEVDVDASDIHTEASGATQ